MSLFSRSLLVASWLALALCPACGGAPAHTEPVARTETVAPLPPRVVDARGEHEASGRFGSAGGTLELASGFRVEVPAGALSAEVELHLSDGAEANVFHPDEGETAVGPTAELTPAVEAAAGRTFRLSAPVVRAPAGFEEADVVLGMEEVAASRAMSDITRTRWQYHRAAELDGRYVSEVAYVGGQRLQFGLTREE